ncbi:(2Fe-2S)-binding protein [Chelativorans xinjiangense]|uniref:(2Fe-2S)-binding protein n=1 Tax=Chelativorans xinjiangense TaxID=2681485 RepID=UPI001FE628B9|nr:(2Fe-2S)-binding protein [Chelativorans xinjiangense]
MSISPGGMMTFTINGVRLEVEAPPETSLIDILREKLGLTAAKEACGIGRCGACNVLMNGNLVNACLLSAWQAEGAEIVSLEGLDAFPETRLLRTALAEENAFQCGYCAPGFTMALTALFREHPEACVNDIRAALEGNICRCTGYHSIIRGALAASKALAASASSGDIDGDHHPQQ